MLENLGKIKEVEKKGLSVKANSLTGEISIKVDKHAYLMKDTIVDEGEYRTVITISLVPLSALKENEVWMVEQLDDYLELQERLLSYVS